MRLRPGGCNWTLCQGFRPGQAPPQTVSELKLFQRIHHRLPQVLQPQPPKPTPPTQNRQRRRKCRGRQLPHRLHSRLPQVLQPPEPKPPPLHRWCRRPGRGRMHHRFRSRRLVRRLRPGVFRSQGAGVWTKTHRSQHHPRISRCLRRCLTLTSTWHACHLPQRRQLFVLRVPRLAAIVRMIRQLQTRMGR